MYFSLGIALEQFFKYMFFLENEVNEEAFMLMTETEWTQLVPAFGPRLIIISRLTALKVDNLTLFIY